jgi:hypothetical protein
MEGMEANFSIVGMWESMTWVGKSVVILLALMSIWSLTIAIERLWRFQMAKKESLQVALGVTPLLKGSPSSSTSPTNNCRLISTWSTPANEPSSAKR